MNHLQLEAWVRDACDRAVAGRPVEDSRVELKTGWPTPQRAARKIAGHANASRGSEVLWLLGVDERRREVPGVDATEFSNWWSQVQAEFDDGSPRVTERVVVISGRAVVALLFDTTGGPFVIRIPMHEGVDRDVPWRDGTSTRSARRADLVKLLAPLVQVPQVEAISCSLYDLRALRGGGLLSVAAGDLRIELEIYFTPNSAERVIFPFHRTSVWVECADGTRLEFREDVAFEVPTHTKIAHADESSLVLYGAAQARLIAGHFGGIPNADPVRLVAKMGPAGCDAYAHIACVLSRRPESYWSWGWTRD